MSYINSFLLEPASTSLSSALYLEGKSAMKITVPGGIGNQAHIRPQYVVLTAVKKR